MYLRQSKTCVIGTVISAFILERPRSVLVAHYFAMLVGLTSASPYDPESVGVMQKCGRIDMTLDR